MMESSLSQRQILDALASPSGLMPVIMDSLPDYVFFKDRELRFVRVNPAMTRLMELTDPQAAVGKTDSDVFHPHDAQKLHDDDLQVLKSRCPVFARERLVSLKDGRTMWLSEDRIPLMDDKGNAVALVGISRDISSVKKMESELRQANVSLSGALAKLKQALQRIIQNERLNALGEMASGIAHDFNNTLMPILGYSEVLLARPEILDDKEEALTMVRDIRTAAMDASQVIRRLREFYRAGTDDEQAAGDLNKQIKTAIVLTRPKWEAEMRARGVHISIQTDLAELPLVSAKESLLREVLLNLLLNAIDAMPEGGTITIRTRVEQDRVALEVRDTGVGMTEDVRKRCLEPFFTTKGEEGTGLGLPLTYGFVQRHKGTIDIDSVPGKGTTITLRLPCRKAGEDAADGVVVGAGTPVQGKRILVIDDEPAARKLLTRYLKMDKHIVETADSGREGINRFHCGKFDLVITDRAMGDMSGDQVAAAIRDKDVHIPVLMLTGFGDIMNESGQHPPGVNLILGKPVTHAVLREGLSRLMAAGSGAHGPPS